MDKPPQKPDASRLRRREKPPWREPEISDEGTLETLVRGGGKTGVRADGDPSNTRKPGMG